jgi:hypothetical protein
MAEDEARRSGLVAFKWQGERLRVAVEALEFIAEKGHFAEDYEIVAQQALDHLARPTSKVSAQRHEKPRLVCPTHGPVPWSEVRYESHSQIPYHDILDCRNDLEIPND